MNRYALAMRQLKRDARSGELTLLVLALIIAVASSTAISLFADRMHRTMSSQAAEFLAADLVITSSKVIPNEWLEKAQDLGLEQARTAEFSSVLIENDELLLAGIKAVSDLYPLRGDLKTKNSSHAETVHDVGPRAGEAWVDSRVLSAIQLAIGDELTVGEKALTVSHVISYEPDKRGDLYSLSPRVMISESDLEATKVLQPGSHVHFFYQFSGEPDALKAFNDWVKPWLIPGQRLMDVQDDRPELGSALSRAERYLGLSSIIVILIAGVAIAMSTRRYSERHFDTTAILRCLGCKQNDILVLFLYQFLLLGLFACSVGLVVGWFTQEALFELLRDLLPAKVAEPSLIAILLGFTTGLAILIGFALPPLLRLKRVSPLRVLRRELEPLTSSAWFVYGLALTLVSILIWRYTEDARLMLMIIGGGLFASAVSVLLLFSLFKQLEKIVPRVGLSWRLGLQGILRSPAASATQILAFSVTLLAMLLSFTVRNDLIQDWQQQLPDNAPNYFALNILPNQVEPLEQRLLESNVPTAHIHPIVRGRLVQINDTPVQQLVTKESQGERATHRDLSLTWGNELPEDNKTVAGSWAEPSVGDVSIESKLAKSLNVAVGDKLTFSIGSTQVSAVVAHVRTVQWDTMKPNFYMVFADKSLDNFPVTYITSFYVAADNKKSLNGLAKQFPNMTLLEVDALLNQFKMILTQLTAAINYLLYFALLAGFTVLFASVFTTLDIRIAEGALMRTLGANKQLLRNAQWLEFSMIGFIAGLIAMLMYHAILFGLYTYVLHLDFNVNVWLIVSVPMLSVVCVTLAGLWGVRDVVKKPPMWVLRDI